MARGMGGHSVADITHHLKGIGFPAGKDDLLAQAKENGAEDDIMQILDSMPDEDFQSIADVMKAVGSAGRGDAE